MKQVNLGILNEIPMDRGAVAQSQLNIEEKTRSNLFPWNGQFSPQLIAALLEAYATPSDFILDPFVGSGTVLVESARRGLSAFGSDINPAPYKIASIFRLANVDDQFRREILGYVEGLLDEAFPCNLFQTAPKQCSQQELKDTLADISASLGGCGNGHTAPKVQELAKIVVDALIVLLDFNRPDISVDRIFACWRKLRERITDLPYSHGEIEAVNCDARRLPLDDDCVDFVVTSPPYINVFNYHQKYRRSMEAIGWDLLHVARSEIGSNRKHRANRYLTVIQYCMDMVAVLTELCRVCVPNARMIVVIGRESNVRKTPFYNADLMARLVRDCLGLQVSCRQERVFTNRFGTSIYEDILHMHNTKVEPSKSTPQMVAKTILCEAREYAPQESLNDLEDAITQVETVAGSPLYESLPELGDGTAT